MKKGKEEGVVQSEEEQQRVVKEIYSMISSRPDSVCNFLEGEVGQFWGKDVKLVYRHYATLYFIFAVDTQESELGMLDLIQVFVEALDKCFENVCELDIIFHPDQIHFILDEIVMGGMVLETNLAEIVRSYREQKKMEREEAPSLMDSVSSKFKSGFKRG